MDTERIGCLRTQYERHPEDRMRSARPAAAELVRLSLPTAENSSRTTSVLRGLGWVANSEINPSSHAVIGGRLRASGSRDWDPRGVGVRICVASAPPSRDSTNCGV